MHHALGVFGLVAAIAFAFGERTARVCVGAALIFGALAVLYVIFRIIEGTI